MRGANNYEMEQTRANRLEQEMQQLLGQYRELENKNAQLKSSNQVRLTTYIMLFESRW